MLANHFVIVTGLAERLEQARAGGLVTFNLTTTEIFPMGEFYYRSGINTFIGPNNTALGEFKYVSLGQHNIATYVAM